MKERKIGEIFEYNGEWYQCVEGTGCYQCAFNQDAVTCLADNPHCTSRSDRKNVVFKKLEKVGKTYIIGNKLIQRYKIYPTTHCINVYGWYYQNLDVKSWTIDIEIKQTKEDMEENKLTLKPFDIQKARAGKPVCTRDGRKARIICFDKHCVENNAPIVACVTSYNSNNQEIEDVIIYKEDGTLYEHEHSFDLMMLPEKKEGWVNVYKGIDGVTFSKHPYTSKDEAIKKSGILFGRIDTIKVSWEE